MYAPAGDPRGDLPQAAAAGTPVLLHGAPLDTNGDLQAVSNDAACRAKGARRINPIRPVLNPPGREFLAPR